MPSKTQISVCEAAERIAHKPLGHHIDGRAFNEAGEAIPTILPDFAAEVDQANGWLDPDELPGLCRDQQFAQAGEFLGEILAWLATSDSLSSAGLRAIALVGAVRPDLLADDRGCNGSQASIGRKFGVTRSAIQQRITEVFELGQRIFVGRTMASPNSRAVASKRAKRVHERLGHKLH